MEYTLIRSRRKTLGLAITKDGALEVRAPLRLPRAAIDTFLIRKSGWIREKAALRQELLREKALFRLEEGVQLPFLGREYTVRSGGGPSLEGESLSLPGRDLRREAEAFYREEARHILPEKAAFWGNRMGLFPEGISVTGAMTRWGSCSAKGRINFSWRLLRAPEEAVDYVVVHELAHLRQMDHSRQFWEIVARILPDWKRRRALLTPVQRRLEAEGWNG